MSDANLPPWWRVKTSTGCDVAVRALSADDALAAHDARASDDWGDGEVYVDYGDAVKATPFAEYRDTPMINCYSTWTMLGYPLNARRNMTSEAEYVYWVRHIRAASGELR